MRSQKGAQPARQGACLFPLTGINVGSTGDAVLFLQGMMVEADCLDPADVTPGVYDEKMVEAVRRYQRRKLGWRLPNQLDGQFGGGTMNQHARRTRNILLNVLIPSGGRECSTHVIHSGVDRGVWPPAA